MSLRNNWNFLLEMVGPPPTKAGYLNVAKVMMHNHRLQSNALAGFTKTKKGDQRRASARLALPD